MIPGKVAEEAVPWRGGGRAWSREMEVKVNEYRADLGPNGISLGEKKNQEKSI